VKGESWAISIISMYVNTLSHYTYVTDGAVRWEVKKQKIKDKRKKLN